MRLNRWTLFVCLGIAWVVAGPTDARAAFDQTKNAADDTRSAPTAAYAGLDAERAKGPVRALAVISVAEGGPAAKAGIKTGDRIITVAGRPVLGVDDLERAFKKPAGTKLKLEVQRGNNIGTVLLTLAPLPRTAAAAQKGIVPPNTAAKKSATVDTKKPVVADQKKPETEAASKPPALPKLPPMPTPATEKSGQVTEKPGDNKPEIGELPVPPPRSTTASPPAPGTLMPEPPVAELPAPKRSTPGVPPLPAPPAQPVPKQAGGPAMVQSGQPSLGVSVVDVTEKMRRRFGLTVYDGALVRSIREGGAAAQAGFPLGAVIVAVDGRRVQSADDLVRTVQTYRPGDQVELTYFESDRMGRKKIRLGQSSIVAMMPKPREPSPERAMPEPDLRMGQNGAAPDRPLLRRLGRALDQIAPELQGVAPRLGRPPASPAAQSPAIAAPASASEVAQLRIQLQTLHEQVQQLQQRLVELEKKQDASGPAPPPPPKTP